MAIEHERALDVYRKYLKSKKRFTFDKIQKEIIKKGGVLRISPGYTLGQFILDQVESGVIDFNRDDHTYGLKVETENERKNRELNERLAEMSKKRLALEGPLWTLQPEKRGRRGEKRGMLFD